MIFVFLIFLVFVDVAWDVWALSFLFCSELGRRDSLDNGIEGREL